MTTKSKVLLIPVLIFCLMLLAFVVERTARAAKKSPHGFNPPQCTWWVDRRCAENSWLLSFTQNYGRDAHVWPALLANGQPILAPRAGCIAVFASWPGGPVGHVAFVESVSGDDFTITHANYRIGEDFCTIDNALVRRANMRVIPNDPEYAQFTGSGMKYRMTYIAEK